MKSARNPRPLGWGLHFTSLKCIMSFNPFPRRYLPPGKAADPKKEDLA